VKLRIKGPTLRLRLTQGEITALNEGGTVEVRLVYRLRRDASARQIEATFRNGALEIRVPEAVARQWCTTELVTLTHEQPTPEGSLRIVLEKDFACLAPRTDEDESDNFPHPGSASGKSC
jgi:hypothetical protein